MAANLRLRQICLAVPRLAPALADLQAIFGLDICHRDPNLVAYGLENALLPIGTDFLELVAPLHEGTAAGRFITRSQGHGGYMAIFQCPSPAEVRQLQAAAAGFGVRTAHEIDRDGYLSAQLHPRDCRAAFIELGYSAGSQDRLGAWWPAGPDWQAHSRTDTTRRLRGIVLESPAPADLALLWSRVLVTPLAPGDAGRTSADAVTHGDPVAGTPGILRFDDTTIGFANGPSDCLGTLIVEALDPAASLGRALDCGYRVQDQGFHLGGVNIQVLASAD